MEKKDKREWIVVIVNNRGAYLQVCKFGSNRRATDYATGAVMMYRVCKNTDKAGAIVYPRDDFDTRIVIGNEEVTKRYIDRYYEYIHNTEMLNYNQIIK